MKAVSFRQPSPGRLEVREGGGCISLFGTPFFLAGLAVILVTLEIIPIENAPSSTARPFLLLMGLAFVAVGGVLVFGRKWTTFSAVDRTVLVEYGFLVSMRQTTHRLEGYTTVHIGFLPGDSDSADQYPITLDGPAAAPFRAFSSSIYAESREGAIAIGKLLDLKIHDAVSAPHAVPLSPAQADLPLQDRQRMEHERDELIVPPASMRSSVTEANGSLTIVIPGRRMASSGLLKRRRTIVTASTTGIRIEERRLLRTRTIANHSASDILDVHYRLAEPLAAIERRRPTMAAPQTGKGTQLVLRIVRALVATGGVTIKTRKGITTIGDGLDDRELRYLHDVIRRALVGSANP